MAKIMKSRASSYSPDRLFTRIRWYAFQVAMTLIFILALFRWLRFEFLGR